MAAREVGAEAAITAGLPLAATLELASTLRLFGLAAGSQATGELTVATEGRAVIYTLFFRRGTVEHAGSTDPADDLGRFLLRKGVLEPETLVAVEAASQAAGGDFVGALISTGVVNPADVAGHLLERGAGVVTRSLACESGTFSWEPGVLPPKSSFPLGSPFAALCSAVRTLDVSAVQRRLGARAQGSASRIVGRVKLEDLRLTPQEARAVQLFDGWKSPAEIAAGQPGDAGVVLRLALLLGEVDLLAFGPPRQPASATPPAPAAQTPVARPPPASAPAPTPARPPEPRPSTPPPTPVARPAPAAPPRANPPAPSPRPAPAPARPPAAAPRAAAAAPSIDEASLRALVEKQKGADHFQILGVKRDSPAAAAKMAYFQLARVYHPDAVPADAAPEVKQICADLFARISEAWAVLGDDAARAKYVQELQSGGVADVDVMRILHAETVFGDAVALVKARRYEEALAHLNEAIQLNTDEAEFGIWKAWCEFLISADKKRQHGTSAAEIEAALRKNAKCVPGYLFLGQMAKVMGDPNLAEKHLRRGLSVAPDHPELVRELKYLRR
jgi:hypothetical protein